MSLLKSEPFAAVTSMDELLAIASVMEQEAIAAYSSLAEMMRREGRADLVAVFDRLVGEESQHLGNVERWSETLSGRKPDLASLRWEPVDTFDDEGAGSIAPELMTAYRAFAMASRNEERAFLFWTYVAAQTDKDALREAAEKMAREELGHLTTLRRERRRAFHAGLDASRSAPAVDLPALEMRLADHLEAEVARNREADPSSLETMARKARARASSRPRRSLVASDVSATRTACRSRYPRALWQPVQCLRWYNQSTVVVTQRPLVSTSARTGPRGPPRRGCRPAHS